MHTISRTTLNNVHAEEKAEDGERSRNHKFGKN